MAKRPKMNNEDRAYRSAMLRTKHIARCLQAHPENAIDPWVDDCNEIIDEVAAKYNVDRNVILFRMISRYRDGKPIIVK